MTLHVASKDFWTWVAVEGTAELTPVAADPHDATVEELVTYYRGINGEHHDWDEYRAAMVADRRLRRPLPARARLRPAPRLTHVRPARTGSDQPTWMLTSSMSPTYLSAPGFCPMYTGWVLLIEPRRTVELRATPSTTIWIDDDVFTQAMVCLGAVRQVATRCGCRLPCATRPGRSSTPFPSWTRGRWVDLHLPVPTGRSRTSPCG